VRKDQKKLQGTENKFIRAVHSLTLDEKKWWYLEPTNK
jgi:hypothetical protein